MYAVQAAEAVLNSNAKLLELSSCSRVQKEAVEFVVQGFGGFGVVQSLVVSKFLGSILPALGLVMQLPASRPSEFTTVRADVSASQSCADMLRCPDTALNA